MNLHVWAYDPGKVTGWCHLSIHGNSGDGEISLFNRGQVNHFELGDMLQNYSVFSQAVTSSDIEMVFIAESFQMTPGKSPAHWSLETIGLIRYWAYWYSIPFTLVSPSSHKTLISNEVLQRADLWTPGQQHARDATKIALYYLITERKVLSHFLLKE